MISIVSSVAKFKADYGTKRKPKKASQPLGKGLIPREISIQVIIGGLARNYLQQQRGK